VGREVDLAVAVELAHGRDHVRVARLARKVVALRVARVAVAGLGRRGGEQAAVDRLLAVGAVAHGAEIPLRVAVDRIDVHRLRLFRAGIGQAAKSAHQGDDEGELFHAGTSLSCPRMHAARFCRIESYLSWGQNSRRPPTMNSTATAVSSSPMTRSRIW